MYLRHLRPSSGPSEHCGARQLAKGARCPCSATCASWPPKAPCRKRRLTKASQNGMTLCAKAAEAVAEKASAMAAEAMANELSQQTYHMQCVLCFVLTSTKSAADVAVGHVAASHTIIGIPLPGVHRHRERGDMGLETRVLDAQLRYTP